MQPDKKPRRTPYFLLVILLVLALVAWYLPFQAVAPIYYPLQPGAAPESAAIAWPAFGQSALGAKDYGLLETHNVQKPFPTASVAKVFTALAVLKQKPLKDGEQGPMITITQADMDSFNSYYAQGGSIAQVALGEQLSERQALEALMLPSANNMAFTLARWAFGSLDAYTSYINSFNAGIGLKNTHIADASGFSPATVSSAEDLVRVGQLAMNNPALASIVSEQQATIPVAGLIHNVNWLLGSDGINGIKTGNTDEAGGCYLFSTVRVVNGKSINVIGAVMGAGSLQEALGSARSLAISSDKGFASQPILTKGQQIGEYRMPWGKKVGIDAADNLSVVSWYKKNPIINFSAKDITKIKKGQQVGTFEANSGVDKASASLAADKDSGNAPWSWRLFKRYL